MYSVQVRKLVLRLAKGVGMSKASRLTAIGRTTIWRWGRFGVDPKRRSYERKLFDECKNELRECLLANPTFTSHDIARALRVSSKSIRKLSRTSDSRGSVSNYEGGANATCESSGRRSATSTPGNAWKAAS